MEKTNAEILKDILQLAKTELNENGSMGYTMPDGKHHIFIYVEENASWDRVKEKSYIVEPNWVVDGAHEPMGDTYGVPYNDFAELLVGCAWCLDWFQAEREAVMVRNYDDAVAHLVTIKALEGGLSGFQPVFESTNYFGLYSGSLEDEFYLVQKATREHTKVMRASDFEAKNYLKELESEAVLDVASGRLLDVMIRNVKVGLFGHDLPEEEYAGIKVLESGLEKMVAEKGKVLLRLGTEVAYDGYSWEVLNVQDGVVFLQNAANDYHWHIPVKRFLDEATLIAEPVKDNDYPYLSRCVDFEYLQDKLSAAELAFLEGIVAAYGDKFDVIFARNEQDEIDFDQKATLKRLDAAYVFTGQEELVIKWLEGFEDSGYLVDSLQGVLDRDDGKRCNQVMKDHFEIEATVAVLDAGGDGWSLKVAGDDLAALKADIIPAIQKLCAEYGYVEGAAVLEMKIEKNLEYFAHEEEMFDLEDLNACITVYRDTLGLPEELDNLTEIVVSKEWLKHVLASEGVDDLEQWLDSYTADETIGIAEKALAEGALLACTDMPFHLGAKVEYGYRLREVVGGENGRVYLQDANDDSHCEPTLAEFFRRATPVKEEDISKSAADCALPTLDAQIKGAGGAEQDALSENSAKYTDFHKDR